MLDKGSDYTLMYKMRELKNIAEKTKNKGFVDHHKLIIITDIQKYDRVYITNLLTKKLLDSIR